MRHEDADAPTQILIVNGSTRSQHTCRGEISKTHRLVERARAAISALPGHEVDVLDVSTLADEPLKVIYPCKACVSTAQPLRHWPCSCYPNHLAGRAFAVVAHGDAAGPENLRRMLVDWLTDIGMVPAGPAAALETWIGWYKPYATSHEDLDADTDLLTQIEHAALSLATMARRIRTGAYESPSAGLHPPREK